MLTFENQFQRTHMNSHIKSQLQFAKNGSSEDIQPMEIPFEANRTQVLKQVRPLLVNRNLLHANKKSDNFIGQQHLVSDDPFGGVLRQLRIQRGIEAFDLATNTCISVWQLYELETGKDTLFYTPGLRNKAAQRVAEYLGSDWSDILQGLVHVEKLPAPVAHVHVLKTPLTETGHKNKQPDLSIAPVQDRDADIQDDNEPFSAANFLRVRDDQN
jgi:hypothetical protein